MCWRIITGACAKENKFLITVGTQLRPNATHPAHPPHLNIGALHAGLACRLVEVWCGLSTRCLIITVVAAIQRASRFPVRLQRPFCASHHLAINGTCHTKSGQDGLDFAKIFGHFANRRVASFLSTYSDLCIPRGELLRRLRFRHHASLGRGRWRPGQDPG
jgi:hypothetical protein